MQPLPAAPVPPTPTAPVVVTVQPFARAIATVLGGAVLVGLVWAVVDALRFGGSYPWRDSGLGSTGQAVGWVVVVLVAVVFVTGVLGSWFLRFEVSATGIRGRALHRWREFPLARIERLRFKAATKTVAPRPASMRAWVRDDTGHRRTVNLAFRITNATDALPVLTGWVRQRPELVQDDTTRTVFRALGA